MKYWAWIASLAVMGFIIDPTWAGWLILAVPAFLIFPPLWTRISLNGFDTRESARLKIASVLTVFLAFGTWSAVKSQQSFAQTDRIIEETNETLAAFEEVYPSEKHTFQWEYENDADPMTDKVVATACITSSNAVNLPPPYEPTRARLCLRNHPKFGRDAFVALQKAGQVMCHSYQDCMVSVRFDKEPQRSFSAVGANDGSTNVFFIRNRAKLEAGIKTADVTAIQAEFYQAGNQIMLFDTKGLDWK